MSASLMKSEQRQEHDNIATITGNRMVAFAFRYVQETPRQVHGNETTGFLVQLPWYRYRGPTASCLTNMKKNTTRFPVIVALC